MGFPEANVAAEDHDTGDRWFEGDTPQI